MNRPKVYIAGKITGLQQHQVQEKFKDKQLELERRGYDVINPVEMIAGKNRLLEMIGAPILTDPQDRAEIMRICIHALTDCQGIYLLPDWRDSTGARQEYEVAVMTGIDIFNKNDLQL